MTCKTAHTDKEVVQCAWFMQIESCDLFCHCRPLLLISKDTYWDWYGFWGYVFFIETLWYEQNLWYQHDLVWSGFRSWVTLNHQVFTFSVNIIPIDSMIRKWRAYFANVGQVCRETCYFTHTHAARWLVYAHWVMWFVRSMIGINILKSLLIMTIKNIYKSKINKYIFTKLESRNIFHMNWS